eukprot:scaffold274_cov135-Isochrysis_galbana.AAC.3
MSHPSPAPAGGGRASREPAPPRRGRPRSPTWSPAHETCERTSSAESAGGESGRISGQSRGFGCCCRRRRCGTWWGQQRTGPVAFARKRF